MASWRLAWVSMALLVSGCGEAPASLPLALRGEPTERASFELLIADRDGDRVLLHDGVVALLVTRDDCALNRPSTARVLPDGRLLVASFGSSRVHAFGRDRAYLGDFFADSGVLEEPVAIRFDAERVYVLGNDTRSTVILDHGGRFISEFGYPAMRDAHDFALGPDGLLYVCTAPTSSATGLVQAWDPQREVMVGSFGPPGELELPTSIAFDPTGRALVSDYRRGTIVAFDPVSGARLLELTHRFERPLSIAFAPDGTLHVLDDAGVWRLDDGERELHVDASHFEGARGISFVP